MKEPEPWKVQPLRLKMAGAPEQLAAATVRVESSANVCVTSLERAKDSRSNRSNWPPKFRWNRTCLRPNGDDG